jgi:hypothetical protein
LAADFTTDLFTDSTVFADFIDLTDVFTYKFTFLLNFDFTNTDFCGEQKHFLGKQLSSKVSSQDRCKICPPTASPFTLHHNCITLPLSLLL